MLNLSLLDAISVWLLIFFYLTGIDLLFLVNINFMIIFAILITYGFCVIKPSYLSGVFFVFLIGALVKGLAFLPDGYGFSIVHCFSYFLGLCIPYFALNFASSFSALDRAELIHYLRLYAVKYAMISFSGIIVYFYFYCTGKIEYFGMGSNLHYIFPFLINKNLLGSTFLFFSIILISGKRAVLMNFIGQCAVIYAPFIRKRPFLLLFALSILVIIVRYLVSETELLNRMTLFFEKDLMSLDDLAIVLSGRFEELLGIFNYFSDHPNQILFGSPPGAFFQWIVPLSDYEATKNYSHITPFGYLFRYGLLFTSIVYGYFIFILIKFWAPKDPFFLVFIGVFTSSFFGANLVIDPLSWFFVGLVASVPSPRLNGSSSTEIKENYVQL